MNSITVCVDYDDYLAITLPRNARHFGRTLVVTSPTDLATRALVYGKHYGACVSPLFTEAFYYDGSEFNKGQAIEQALAFPYTTMQVLAVGMEDPCSDWVDDWIVLWDADTIMPKRMDLSGIEPGNIYSPYRRMLEDAAQFRDGMDWSKLPEGPERRSKEFAGYFFLFHPQDPVLATPPWYPTNWRHAGGGDTEFYQKWPPEKRKRLPFEVLHLGPLKQNWCGRHTPRLDGTLPQNAAQHKQAMEEMLANRARWGYDKERTEPVS